MTGTFLPSEPVDLLIVGGGINGCGIACDAAGRGLSVVLCEQGDLGGATSSASSKLIHGGLRYLEHFAFRLVREGLAEREVLLAKAPHIIHPMSFVLPHAPGLRPAWMIRVGLALYDRLGGRRALHGSRAVDLANAPEGAPLKDGFRRGFVYADAYVDDARLVVLNALAAERRGARILTRTECVSARRARDMWEARLTDRRAGDERLVRARAVVNAAGPWVEGVFGRVEGAANGRRMRLVKGSHIVVPRLHDRPEAYILQNPDRRVVFVIPFEGAYSLIGTTEEPFADNPAAAEPEPHEIDYLCAAVNRYFRREVSPADVAWSFAGVRPLWDDAAGNASAVTREYALDLHARAGPPLLTVYGGKITTYRTLAEQALLRLRPFFPHMGAPWSAAAPLPGGEQAEGLRERLSAAYPWLPASLADRYARSYGDLAFELLGDAGRLADLGTDLGAGLHEREAAYLIAHEWAETEDDILWRRTKLGLRMSSGEAEAFTAWLAGCKARV